MRISVAIGLVCFSAGCFAKMPALDCGFDKAYLFRHSSQAKVDELVVRLLATIVDGVTTKETGLRDGSSRAVNSRNWKRIESIGWEAYQTSFVGDLREILTIDHDLGANTRPLRGTFRASLATPGVDQTQILTGTCTAK
jgi:hypothetical protein